MALPPAPPAAGCDLALRVPLPILALQVVFGPAYAWEVVAPEARLRRGRPPLLVS